MEPVLPYDLLHTIMGASFGAIYALGATCKWLSSHIGGWVDAWTQSELVARRRGRLTISRIRGTTCNHGTSVYEDHLRDNERAEFTYKMGKFVQYRSVTPECPTILMINMQEFPMLLHVAGTTPPKFRLSMIADAPGAKTSKWILIIKPKRVDGALPGCVARMTCWHGALEDGHMTRIIQAGLFATRPSEVAMPTCGDDVARWYREMEPSLIDAMPFYKMFYDSASPAPVGVSMPYDIRALLPGVDNSADGVGPIDCEKTDRLHLGLNADEPIDDDNLVNKVWDEHGKVDTLLARIAVPVGVVRANHAEIAAFLNSLQH